jgi:hypothetical protein
VAGHDDVTSSAVRFARAPRAVWRSIPGMLVVTVGAAAPLRISGSAPLVWQVLESPGTFDELVERLQHQVDASPGHLEQDVRRLLDELVAQGSVTAQ